MNIDDYVEEHSDRDFDYGRSDEQMSEKQVVIVKKIYDIGRLINEEHPEMADDYRNGMTHSEIASKYGIAEKYQLTEDLSIQAVYRAIRGGGKGKSFFGPLIPLEERAKLQKEHQRENWRKKGRAAAEARGQILWSKEEKEEFEELSEYDMTDSEIAHELNIMYHEGKQVRSGKAVSGARLRMREKLKEAGEQVKYKLPRWPKEETLYLIELLETGSDCETIANLLNEEHGNNRTPKKVRSKTYEIRKSQKTGSP